MNPMLVVAAEPRPCLACDGVGERRTPCRCHHSLGCPSHGSIGCEACRGSGAVQCEYCGEDDGTVQTVDGLFCAACAGEVAHG